MNTIKLGKSVLFIAVLAVYMLVVGYIRDNVVSPQYKLWVNLTAIGLLVVATVVNVTYKERSKEKPDYRTYFYMTMLIFLYVSISLLMIKR